jgi:hypothetical protein
LAGCEHNFSKYLTPHTGKIIDILAWEIMLPEEQQLPY